MRKAVARIRMKLIDRYLFAWRLWRIWRDRKIIFESKIIDIKLKYLSWKIKRLIEKQNKTNGLKCT